MQSPLAPFGFAGEEAQGQIMKTRVFMEKHADLNATRTQSGYNSLLEDFANTSFYLGSAGQCMLYFVVYDACLHGVTCVAWTLVYPRKSLCSISSCRRSCLARDLYGPHRTSATPFTANGFSRLNKCLSDGSQCTTCRLYGILEIGCAKNASRRVDLNTMLCFV